MTSGLRAAITFSAVGAGRFEERVVADLMTPSVITCDAADSMLVAIRKMYEHTIRHLVVMNGDQLAGVISLRDVLDAMFITIEEREKAANRSEEEGLSSKGADAA